MIRVLHVGAGNMYGGIERVLVTLAKHRDTMESVQTQFALPFEGRLAEELRQEGVAVHRLPAVRTSRPWTVLSARRQLRKLIKAQQIDALVTHSFWPHAVFAPAARAAGVPCAFWAHDAVGGQSWLERWAFRSRPDFVIANSAHTLSTCQQLIVGIPSATMTYPVPAPASADPSIRSQIRNAHGVPPEAVVIVTACRMEAWKGHPLLLEALGKMTADPAWTCWIIGGAQRPHEITYLEELKAAARRLGISERVKFLGQKSDVYSYLLAADIHCQSNAGAEPFGVAFVEAMYAGLPVVTTHMGAPAEYVSPDCGVLVPPGQAGPLAAALLNLVNNHELRRALGSRGPARAAQMASPQKQMLLLEGLLSSLIVKPDAVPSPAGAAG